MKSFTARVTVALLFGLLLCETQSIVRILYPETEVQEYSLWLSNNYKEKITLLWYMYEMAGILNRAIWIFCFAMTAKMVSYRLFKILFLFFCYEMTQFLFYIYNRNSSFFSNIILYIYMGLAIIFLLTPDKKQGKIIEL